MSSRFGENFRVQLFGESHGPSVGVTIEGIPPGFCIDHDAIAQELARRAPGGALTTARKESDAYRVVSGEYNGRATGTPFTAIIRNTDTRSRDYQATAHLPRPGHADYTGAMRYKGYQDIRGGGHFSARLTAVLVIAGAIARQMLARRGVAVAARIVSVGTVHDASSAQWTPQM
ncbi:MAG: chorismate synthase, partial [Eubacteriales bacterium]|nr:chorismate synthase [Eubacteriales bacterium]